MNDVGGEHLRTNSRALGVEVHVTAFSTTDDSNLHLPNSTFYRYRIINKNSHPIENAYFEFFRDADLGYFGDDYVGSDSTLNLSFAYNGDNFDENEFGYGYGKAPPAVGYQVLVSPLATSDLLDNDDDGIVDVEDEMLGMTSFINYFGGGGVQGGPGNGEDMYNYMQGRWKD